jgi:hypothetical protein
LHFENRRDLIPDPVNTAPFSSLPIISKKLLATLKRWIILKMGFLDEVKFGNVECVGKSS